MYLDKITESIGLQKLVDYINGYNGKIDYFFNAKDSRGTETTISLKAWLLEVGLLEKTIDKINFIKKDYGWVIDAIEARAEPDSIVYVLDYMIQEGYKHSKEITPEEIEDMEYDIDEKMMEFLSYGGEIYFPYMMNELKKLPGGTIIGGGSVQCLMEIELVLEALGIEYSRNNDYIY
jgi:hypothetical protein